MKKIISYFIGAMLLALPMTLTAQTITENSVVNKTYRVPLKAHELGTKNKDSVSITIQYLDGLGRLKQSVAVQAGGELTYKNNLLYDWTLNNSGSTPFYNQEGLNSENTIVNGTTPFGDTDLLWECKEVQGAGGSGWTTDFFAVDKTKPYRYTTWVKRTGNLTEGAVYHGPYSVNNLDGTSNTNPYFWYGDLPQIDTWYLLVGYIHPSDYTGADVGISGVYDVLGNKVLDGTEFKWNTTATTARFRNYMFNVTDTSIRQYFWSPLLQKIDGTELSVNQVVNTPTVVLPETVAKDIVTPIEYDAYGRQMKEYLPYASGYTDGRINTNAIGKNQTYYLGKHAADFAGITDPAQVNAYSEKTMENSPLGRIFEQTAPGKDWIKSNTILNKGYSDGHTIKFEHHANQANEVKKYTVGLTFANKTYTPALQGGTTSYPAGELTKTITKDENWITSDGLNHTTEEFKNKSGQVILKRTYADIDYNKNAIIESGDAQRPHDTYYIYDDYGNLSYVLPPKAEPDTTVPTQTVLDELCYQYVYDHRNRLVEKKIPGKGWEYIVYDRLDRPVLTQDEIQRSKSPKEWLFTKYDNLGRVVYTGIWTYSSSRAGTQDNFNNATGGLGESLTTVDWIAGTRIYHTNGVLPISSITEIHTVNYYDTYIDFPNGSGLFATVTTSYGITSTTNTKGLPTVSKTRVLGVNPQKWITTVTYYDEKARPIYIYSHNAYLETTDIVESKLDDFTGRVIETKTTHKKTGKADIVTIDKFEYDHRDRLLTQTQKINNQATERLTKNHYDDLGQLESKLVGNGAQKGYTDVTSGLTVANNTITKTGAAGWNEGLATLGSIEKDGYIEYVAKNTTFFMVGLSSSNADASYCSIKYAIYNEGTGIGVYESCGNKGNFGSYQVGDVFRIERIGDTIYYKRNGEIFYISQTPSTGTLIGDISMYSTNAEIEDLHIVDNSKGLQKVDYAYNVRGWLKNINSDSDNDNDLFNFSLKYNVTSGTPLYNGNISQIVWNTASADTSSKAYTYTYDALNRIRYGQSNDVVGNTSKYSLHSVFYDKNGNIENLYRNGHNTANPDPNNANHWGLMDNLIYIYDAGNKLTKVTDYADDNYGFKDGNKVGDDFTYDVNGNMITDKNKNITNITYNHLNLPTKVVFNNQDPLYSQNPEAIEYVYDALGMKQRKTVKDGVKITTTDYAGNYIYENSDLQFFSHAEGYTKYENSTFNNIYQYKDHLGNVRLSYTDINGDGTIDVSSNPLTNEIVEESNYYPFGLKHKGYNYVVNTAIGNSTAQKFKYNGMELENSLGIDWYEMDMRQYDPALARWTSIDPVTHHSMSTYTAFDNNPIFWADPSGADSQVNWDGDYGPNSAEAAANVETTTETTTSTSNSNSTEASACPSCKTEEDWKNYYSQGYNTALMLGEDYNFGGERFKIGLNEDGRKIFIVDGKIMDLKAHKSVLHAFVSAFDPSLFLIAAFPNLFKGSKNASKAKGSGLSENVAKTFRGKTYEKIILEKPVTLSRYYDNVNAFAKGRYMTNSSSLTGNIFVDRMALALKPKWNLMTKTANWELPVGTTVFKGKAATQFPWIGGGTQYFVPNLNNLKRVIKP
jgi:RHS repeat-associated protein